jgi:hypothetical protein
LQQFAHFGQRQYQRIGSGWRKAAAAPGSCGFGGISIIPNCYQPDSAEPSWIAKPQLQCAPSKLDSQVGVRLDGSIAIDNYQSTGHAQVDEQGQPVTSGFIIITHAYADLFAVSPHVRYAAAYQSPHGPTVAVQDIRPEQMHCRNALAANAFGHAASDGFNFW